MRPSGLVPGAGAARATRTTTTTPPSPRALVAAALPLAPPPTRRATRHRSSSSNRTTSSSSSFSSSLVSSLWSALLASGADKAREAAAAARRAADGAAERARRYAEPPPAGFPPGPPGDAALTLLSDPLGFIASVTDRYGPVAGLLLGGERVVLVSDAAAARQVLLGATAAAPGDGGARASFASASSPSAASSPAFVKEGTAFFPGSALTGNGLLVSDGEVWRRQRRLSNPAFRRAAVEGYGACMVRGAERLFGGGGQGEEEGGGGGPPLPSPWEHAADDGGVRDVYADFNALTLEVALEALFGLPAGPTQHGREEEEEREDGGGGDKQQDAALLGARVVQAVERAFRYFAARGASAGGPPPLPEWVPTLENAEFAAAVRDLDALVYGIIADRRRLRREQQEQQGGADEAASSEPAAAQKDEGARAARGTGDDPRPPPARRAPDLLQSLLEASEAEGEGGEGGQGQGGGGGMDDRALRDELMTLLVAGQETSAIALGWACALLAGSPEVQSWAAEGARAALAVEEEGNEGSEGSEGGEDGRPRLRAPTSADAFSGALVRVEAVVLEALRLWSPAYMVGRCASRDVELCALPVGEKGGGGGGGYYYERAWEEEEGQQKGGGAPAATTAAVAAAAAAASLALIEREARPASYRIPKGTTVLVSPYLLHRDPRWWGGPRDAAAFRPQRWLELAGRSSDGGGNGGGDGDGALPPAPASGPLWPAALRDLGPNGAYVPFGAGPRVCIGTGFAMMEAVLVLSALLARYELSPPRAEDGGGDGKGAAPPPPFPRPAAVLTLRPEAVPLRIRRRRWGAA